MLHAAAALFAAAYQLPDRWLTFSRAPAFDRRITIVEVGTVSDNPAERHYWFKRTVRKGRATQVWFADTMRCPAARWVVDEVKDVAPPQITFPGDPSTADEIIVTADGASYVIEVSARYGKNIGSDIRFTSNVHTPLADWADESLRRLDPCWSKVVPVVR